MTQTVIMVVVGLIVLIGGAWIAVRWWRIVANIAPYADEVERAKSREAAQRAKDERVVVIKAKKGEEER